MTNILVRVDKVYKNTRLEMASPLQEDKGDIRLGTTNYKWVRVDREGLQEEEEDTMLL
ncbi:hypothetical protein E2C01_077776 [Portunus trituberculatus]|uniref:Uncharacterized protein n=1 Tax=Portunus trituberculatus TaxID=210409 RepID=A0A5B7IL58_PORTR|nr:hypothetical protein [Portunus trituberculatus]